MSVRIMTAVWTVNLPDSEKIVLLALADCANDEGLCWPSMATLSAKCSKSEFITILTPCLQLVAPAGMSEDAQDTWFEAARLALARFPASLLRRGAEHAMMHADHPSKIVPLIVKEAGPAMEQRQRIARGRDDQPRTAALPAPGAEYCTPGELDGICRQLKVGRYSQHRPPRDPARPTAVTTDADPNRPCRAPMREDYIRLFGIDPEAPPAPAAEAA